MSQRPTVSVIINYHNEGDLLTRALDSVCAQKFSGSLEMILVDDASTEPPQLRPEYRWPVRMVRSEKNVRLPAARNLGVKHSQGDLICFLDADDVYLPERISSHVNFLQSRPDVIMVCGPHYTETRGEAWLHIPRAVSECFRTMHGHRCALPAAPFVFPEKVRVDVCASYFLHAGMMTARRAALEKVGGFTEDNRWGEDWDLAVRLAQSGKIGFVPTPGMRYLCRSGTMSSTQNPDKQVAAAITFRSWRRTIPGLPFRYRCALRSWERQNLLIAAQLYWEEQRRAPLALRCALTALFRMPSVWAVRSTVRMALHTIVSGLRLLPRNSHARD